VKYLLALSVLLALSSGALAGIEGSTVTLIEPWTPPDLWETATFRFLVSCTSTDDYSITGIHLTFDGVYVLEPESMGWAPGPNWQNSVGTWEMSDDRPPSGNLLTRWRYGQLVDGEDCYTYLDLTYAPAKQRCMWIIDWRLYGEAPGEDPCEVSGVIDMGASPVDESSWGAIKALFR